MPRRSRLIVAAAAVLVLGCSACSSMRYYGQAVRGGLDVVLGAKRIDKLLTEGDLEPEVARQLRLVGALRDFARDTLCLDVKKQYTRYHDLGRDIVVWNVVAAPELGVVPVSWCFPVAGCVSYRGYFKRPGADRFAAKMREAGFDVSVGGAAAYSTLGWLRDPVLNTFLGRSDAELAGLLFHELAHATLYAKNDTAFNESFATVVEHAGVEQWLESRGRGDEWRAFAERADAEREITERLAALRDALDTLFRSDVDDEGKRSRKAALIDRFQRDLSRDITSRPALAPWRVWAERDINNADLASVGVYWQWVEPLEARLDSEGWPSFIDSMRDLARRSLDDRRAVLEAHQ